jgi:GAF domain-containing protein
VARSLQDQPKVRGEKMEARERGYYKALYSVARAVSSSLDLQQVLDSIVTSATWAVGAKACLVRLLDSDRDELLATASFGLSQEYLGKGGVALSENPTDRQVLQGQVVYMNDVTTDARFKYRDDAKREGLASLLILPLMVEGRAIGVMRFYTRFPRAFTPDEIDFLGAIADLSGLAVENARVHQSVRTDLEALTSWFTMQPAYA